MRLKSRYHDCKSGHSGLPRFTIGSTSRTGGGQDAETAERSLPSDHDEDARTLPSRAPTLASFTLLWESPLSCFTNMLKSNSSRLPDPVSES